MIQVINYESIKPLTIPLCDIKQKERQRIMGTRSKEWNNKNRERVFAMSFSWRKKHSVKKIRDKIKNFCTKVKWLRYYEQKARERKVK